MEQGNNRMASSYKIGDNEYGTVLNFINIHGYRTGINEEDQTVYIRNSRGSFSDAEQPPAVYIDDIQEFDLNLLQF